VIRHLDLARSRTVDRVTAIEGRQHLCVRRGAPPVPAPCPHVQDGNLLPLAADRADAVLRSRAALGRKSRRTAACRRAVSGKSSEWPRVPAGQRPASAVSLTMSSSLTCVSLIWLSRDVDVGAGEPRRRIIAFNDPSNQPQRLFWRRTLASARGTASRCSRRPRSRIRGLVEEPLADHGNRRGLTAERSGHVS
jgi:hypothetical protein